MTLAAYICTHTRAHARTRMGCPVIHRIYTPHSRRRIDQSTSDQPRDVLRCVEIGTSAQCGYLCDFLGVSCTHLLIACQQIIQIGEPRFFIAGINK